MSGDSKKGTSTPALDNCFYSLPADEPLETPTPPISRADRKVGTEINEAPLRPILAFEKFAGKVLDTSGADFSDSLGRARLRQLSSARPEFVSHAPSSARPTIESPFDRFARLKHEIKQFQQDLDSITKDAPSSGSGSGSSNNDPIREVSTLMTRELTHMETQLSSLAHDDRYRAFIDPPPLPVSAAVAASSAAPADPELARLMGQLQSFASLDGKKAAPSKTPSSSVTSTPVEQPTYELYYSGNQSALPSASTAAASSAADIAALDRRIANAEKLLGNTADGSPAFPDIQTGIRHLHRKLELIDQVKLDAVGRRVKTLTSELEALQAARTELAGGKGASPHDEKVNTMYAMMTRWDKAAQTLPTVVARLQTLRDVHEESANLVLRVQQVEQQHEAVERLLSDDKKALEKLTESLAVNARLMQGNVELLDARFATLSAKMDLLNKPAKK